MPVRVLSIRHPWLWPASAATRRQAIPHHVTCSVASSPAHVLKVCFSFDLKYCRGRPTRNEWVCSLSLVFCPAFLSISPSFYTPTRIFCLLATDQRLQRPLPLMSHRASPRLDRGVSRVFMSQVFHENRRRFATTRKPRHTRQPSPLQTTVIMDKCAKSRTARFAAAATPCRAFASAPHELT